MSTVKSMIASIQKQCRGYSDVSAEALMYGIANIIWPNCEKLEAFLEQHGYDKELIASEKEKVSAIIHRKGLNLWLIINGSIFILSYFKGDENSEFFKGLLQLNESSLFHSIVSYIVDGLDKDYIAAFQEGHFLKDIMAYSSKLGETKATKNQRKAVNEGHIEKEYAKPIMNDYQLRFNGFLAELPLEESQKKSITARISSFVESLTGSDKEIIPDQLYRSLIRIEGVGELNQAYSKRSGKNGDMAKYKAAGHKVMRNLRLCLEQYKERSVSSADRLFYLSEKYEKVYKQLIEKVIGQDYAINEFVQSCFDAELYNDDPDHPQAVFLFAGPPGIGKTFLAKNVADTLQRPFKVFDMASFAAEKSELGLVGDEPLFEDAIEGTLVGFVEDNPDAIILFDEIEKAHPDVTRLFLSVLDGARLENKYLSSNTDFSQTILIFTTNAGKAIYESNKKNLSATPTDVIIKELLKEQSEFGRPKFPPELCSRFASQHIVMFNHIGISDMVSLVVKHLDETCKEIEEKLQIIVEYDKRLALLLLMHFGNTDVRVVTGQAQQFIRREVYELSRHLVRMKDAKKITKIILSLDDTRISEKAKAFFSAADFEETILAIACDEETRGRFESLKDERIRFFFIDSEEKLLECDADDVTAFLVDPYYSMYKTDDRILGLDDYDSVGLRIIKSLLQKSISAPVYLLESGKKVSQTDKNTLYMKGIEDTVCFDEEDPSKVIKEIVAERLLQKKCSAMLNRRKVFDFDSLQEMPDENGVVNIKFYDIIVKDAVRTEDQDLLINIEERPDVKFCDVIGADNAKDELKDFVKYLENPNEYMKHSLAVPKGVLLYGPPGTGKTMLAKALAGETDAAFISVSLAKILGSKVDIMDRLFTTARKYAPAIIFIDEVDAIAHKRTGIGFSNYEETLLNMLLAQMDGFERHDNTPVFVVAATNFSIETSDNSSVGELDPAFLRRFGNKILVDLPNKEEKLQFLSKRLKSKTGSVLDNLVTGEGMKNIAERTPGESLANIENILELSFRNAARKGKQLDDELLGEAMEEYYYGEKKTRDEEQIYRIAIHEASHAYIYSLSGKRPTYLTVTSRGKFGGYMQIEDAENKATTSKEECIWSIRTSLAGRIGEMAVFSDEAALNTGAGSDLRKASSLALNMLTSFGMQEGHLFTLSHEELLQSNLMPIYVEKAEEILIQEEKICYDLVAKGKEKIIALAKALVEKNHLNREEIARLVGE